MAWKNPGTLGFMNRILWDVGIKLFKTHRTRTVLKIGTNGIAEYL